MDANAFFVMRAVAALAVAGCGFYAVRRLKTPGILVLALAAGLLALRDLLVWAVRLPPLGPLVDDAVVALYAAWAFYERRHDEPVGPALALAGIVWLVAALSIFAYGAGANPDRAFLWAGQLPLFSLLGVSLFARSFLVRGSSSTVGAIRLPMMAAALALGALAPLFGYDSRAVHVFMEPALYLFHLWVILSCVSHDDRVRNRAAGSFQSILDLSFDSLMRVREGRDGRADRFSHLLAKGSALVGGLFGAEASFFLFIENDHEEVVRLVGNHGAARTETLLVHLGLEGMSGARDKGGGEAAAELFRLRPDSILRAMVADERVAYRDLPSPSERAAVVAVPSASANRLHGALVGVRRGEGRWNGSGTAAEGLALRAVSTLNAIRAVSESTAFSPSEVERRAAAEVQTILLPRRLPEFRSLKTAAVCRIHPGGNRDFYDVLPMKSGKTLVAVADVTGTRISVAVFMPMIRALLCLGAGMGAGIEKILGWLNYVSLRREDLELVASISLLSFDPETREIETAGAGNIPVLRFDQQALEVEVLRSEDPPLGIQDGTRFGVRRIAAEVGDVFVLCSDGVAEAVNRQHVQFGMGGLKNTILANNQLSAPDMAAKIARDLDAFTLETEQSDDWSLLVAKMV